MQINRYFQLKTELLDVILKVKKKIKEEVHKLMLKNHLSCIDSGFSINIIEIAKKINI